VDGNLQKIFDKLMNKTIEMLSTGEVEGESSLELLEIIEEYDEYIEHQNQELEARLHELDYQRKWNR